MAQGRRVSYICNSKYLSTSDKYIRTKNRNIMVHSLIKASGLLNNMINVVPFKAKFQHLTMFHSEDYIKFLQETETPNFDDSCENIYGLGYDCPILPNLFEYCCVIAGGSICGARLLTLNKCDVAIHWAGGWHHAKREQASGYCYVNDCVLAILELRTVFRRVMYIDIDLHHGDGVEEAFSMTDKVLTFSMHKFEAGFFPGTGLYSDIGLGKGKYYTTNIPLKDGATDKTFIPICSKVLKQLKQKFNPDAVVCQMGADGLTGDPMLSFNLTPNSLISCIELVLDWKLPTLILGGGGYNEVNVAKCWCQVTAAALGIKLNEEIPDHEFFLEYGADYEFPIIAGSKRDSNTEEYISELTNNVLQNVDQLQS